MYHILRFLAQKLILYFENDWGRLFLWLPVGVGFGIALYFSLPQEPAIWIGLGALGLLGSLAALAKGRPFLLFLTVILWVIAFGFTCAQWPSHSLGASMISQPLGQRALQGEVERIELRPEGQRLTLKNIRYKFNASLQPQKVRIAVRGKLQPSFALRIGQIIALKAVLLPPSEPTAPGAYNFRRRAYFEGIDAVGFATSPPVVIEGPSPEGYFTGLTLKWAQIRQSLTQRLRQGIGGREGEIAAALVTGERSGIPRDLQQSFADAGIAHILAISGLHLSIIAGLIFFMVRRSLSLIPWVALNYPVKKWAAALSILFTSAYLGLCWGSIPALRAFFMTAIVMWAIILDRTALSMRNVAIAALVILIIWPESLLSPSFQLSFSAVIALIAVYEGSQVWLFKTSARRSFVKRFLLYIFGIVITTLVASLATTPFSISFFHRFSLHAVSANLAAIPLTTLWIMPLAVLSAFLMPFNCEAWALQLLGSGIGYLIGVADQVSGWPGAVILVPETSPAAVAFMAVGGLWLCLWKQPWRWWGIGSIALGLFLVATPNPPDIYVSGDGKLAGVRSGRTLRLTSLRSGSFTRGTWLAHQGLDQAQALEKQFDGYKFYIPRVQKNILIRSPFGHNFGGGNGVISLDGGSSLHITSSDLQQQGAHAVWLMPNQAPVIRTVVQGVGVRPWSLVR